jgi:hypothetical protein
MFPLLLNFVTASSFFLPCSHDNRTVYWDVPLKSKEEEKVVGMQVHLGDIKGAREWADQP